jgi:hypothetical protein
MIVEEIGVPFEWGLIVAVGELSQSAWNGVIENPPLTFMDEWAYCGRPLGQHSARCVFLCRMKWRLGWVWTEP